MLIFIKIKNLLKQVVMFNAYLIFIIIVILYNTYVQYFLIQII